MKTLLLSSVLAIPALVAGFSLSAQAPAPDPQVTPPPSLPNPVPFPKHASACFIHADEVWLTSDPGSIPAGIPSQPAVATNSKTLFLHVKLTNRGHVGIVGFSVHADLQAPSFDLHPRNGPDTPTGEAHDSMHRRWTGDLAPQAQTSEQWKLKVGQQTSVLNKVWFDKVTFADGSTWEGDHGDTCSFSATGHMVPAKSPSRQAPADGR